MNKVFICDTNVLISSLFHPKSPPLAAIQYIKSIVGYLSFSEATFDELAEVLERPKFDAFITKEKRRLFLEEIQEVALFFDVSEKVNLCRDPKDNKFLDLAMACHANCLITGDTDLLVLKKIGDTVIVTPKAFITKNH